jgi:hypothetical protein
MSKWTEGVNEYVEEMREFLEENNLEATRENLLNGAHDWLQASYGGSWLIYDVDIAERLATPSEVKSRTRKDGSFNQMANASESWLDVQARALYQASNRVVRQAQQLAKV